MPLWVPVTLTAATFQILRTARQHRLTDQLSLLGAAYVRFLYGLPFAVGAAALTAAVSGPLPSPPARFWMWVTAGGVVQILGTASLLASFERRSFALGNVFSKTEIVQVAIVSSLILGESLKPLGWLGAAVCMIGVIWLVAPDGLASLRDGLGDKAAFMGALAGGLFALAAVSIRGAANTMDGDAWPRAIVTLTVMLAIQTLVNGIMLVAIPNESPVEVARAWRAAWTIGLLSLCGSAAWALAMTLTNAAKVRTLGQIELVIGFAVSVLWLREEHTRQEYLASALVLLGILAVIAFG